MIKEGLIDNFAQNVSSFSSADKVKILELIDNIIMTITGAAQGYTTLVATMTMPSAAATTSQQSTNNRKESMRRWL